MVLNVISKAYDNSVLSGRFWVLIALFLCFLSTHLSAQVKVEAFQSIKAGISFQENVNRNDFHEYWKSNPALQIDLETPFYKGNILLTGRYVDFNAKEEELPGIHNFDITVSWGGYYPVFENLKIGGSAGLLYSMYSFYSLTEEMVEYSRIYGTTSPESEIGFVVRADLVYQLNKNWGVQLNWNRNIAYTYNKVKLNYVGVGIYRVFNTPEWFKKILK